MEKNNANQEAAQPRREIDMKPQYSIIIPSRGDRPKALRHALECIHESAQLAGLLPDGIEVLVGFDGVRGERVSNAAYIKYFDFPTDNDFGNAIRHGLLKASKGRRIIFHDDDNALLPHALSIYNSKPDVEMIIARIDVSRAFDKPFLPEVCPGRETVRQCNIDPLCLCLSRELVYERCGGWQGKSYEADFLNIVRYYRRAGTVEFIDNIIGIYDAGRGLDDGGLNFRQKRLENPKQ